MAWRSLAPKITGMLIILEKETGIDKEIILTNIDKAHPIERVENSKQLRIVKFRSDCFKEVIYKKV